MARSQLQERYKLRVIKFVIHSILTDGGVPARTTRIINSVGTPSIFLFKLLG